MIAGEIYGDYTTFSIITLSMMSKNRPSFILLYEFWKFPHYREVAIDHNECIMHMYHSLQLKPNGMRMSASPEINVLEVTTFSKALKRTTWSHSGLVLENLRCRRIGRGLNQTNTNVKKGNKWLTISWRRLWQYFLRLGIRSQRWKIQKWRIQIVKYINVVCCAGSVQIQIEI